MEVQLVERAGRVFTKERAFNLGLKEKVVSGQKMCGWAFLSRGSN